MLISASFCSEFKIKFVLEKGDYAKVLQPEANEQRSCSLRRALPTEKRRFHCSAVANRRMKWRR